MNQDKIAKLIKQIRKDNNLTQKDFADKYNVTYQAVSKWENGKNLPDMSLLKKISDDYNISLDGIFEGEIRKQNKKNNIVLILGFIILILLIILIVFLIKNNNEESFEFKTINANCSNFELSGSIAYNNAKSSIYISNINYCGKEDLEQYDEIVCTLYEIDDKTTKEIDKYKYDNKISLEEFLKKLSFNIDNYQSMCKNFKKDCLYLEINATKNGKTTTYKVPLELKGIC